MFWKLLTRMIALSAAAIVPPSEAGQNARAMLTENEVLYAEDARYAAQTANDFPAMEILFGDDLVYVHSTAVVDTKASFMDSIRSGRVKYRRMGRVEEKVRIYGSVGIITGRARFDVTADGADSTVELLFHSVWTKRTPGMQFVSWQATLARTAA